MYSYWIEHFTGLKSHLINYVAEDVTIKLGRYKRVYD